MTPSFGGAQEGRLASRFLALDIGNSAVKAGLFADNEVVSKRVWLHGQPSPEEALKDWLRSEILTGAAVCSVVPEASGAWIAATEEATGTRPYLLGPQTDFGLQIRPTPPESVGRDRLANAVAAFEQHGGPVIPVSIGTACTVDAVTAKGEFLGGAIAPGPETSLKALTCAGAQLPETAFEIPEHAIGRSTTEAIQSGAVLGFAAMVDGLIERIASELGGDPVVVCTGGLAPFFHQNGLAKRLESLEPNLTLDGIRRVWLRNRT